ncbi:MAG TPA: MBOAT family protein [Verrucomicrobiae bacterium]|nr:MBOAT family protein [Verrucomicrobiae bacterium]
MNIKLKRPDRKLLLWPLAGIVITVLAAANPFHAPGVPLSVGVVIWCVDMVLVLTLAANPVGARTGVLMAGLFLAVPCFVRAPSLVRALLMCFASMPLVIASAPVLFPEIIGFRTRLYFLCTWGFTREVKRRACRFNIMSLVQLIAATAIFAAAFAAEETISAIGVWMFARWLAFGIVILAFAEMTTACHNLLTALMGLTAPALMQSPHLSASLNEFWTKRWNPATSVLIRFFSFKPLARYGVTMAMFATFFVSGVAHALLVFMATEEWSYSLANGTFFWVQPVFILIERQMKIRLWRPAARRAWTISVLAITSPLFVAPALKVIGRGWGKWEGTLNVLPPTVATLSFVVLFVIFFSLASLVSCPEYRPSNIALEPTPMR